MKMEEVFTHTFKAMRRQIDAHKAPGRRLWQQRLGTASEFCRAVVSNGYLSEEQMQRVAQRYRLGASRDVDGQTYRDWYDIAEAASDVFGHPVTVSTLLEQRATPAQKAAKIDLVDLLF